MDEVIVSRELYDRTKDNKALLNALLDLLQDNTGEMRKDVAHLIIHFACEQ